MANLTYQPAWLTDELNKLLDALPMDAHHRKRRTTVLRMAEAAATGQTEKSVFAQPDTCGWKAWDGQYSKDAEGHSYKKPGWRDDPATQAALEAAKRRAMWYQDQAEARRIAKRQEDVAKARDKLAELAWPAVLKLGAILGAENLEIARKAANDILDRADKETASKAEVAAGLTVTLIGVDPDADDHD